MIETLDFTSLGVAHNSLVSTFVVASSRPERALRFAFSSLYTVTKKRKIEQISPER